MDWKDVGRSVAAAAPALGVALGGPAGGAIGSLIATAFGSNATPAAVAQAISSDPESAVRLREVELRHSEVLATLAVQQAEALVQRLAVALMLTPFLRSTNNHGHTRTTHSCVDLPP